MDIELEPFGIALLAVNFVGAEASLSTAQYILAAAGNSTSTGTYAKVYGGDNAITINKKTGLKFSVSVPSNVWVQACVLYID